MRRRKYGRTESRALTVLGSIGRETRVLPIIGEAFTQASIAAFNLGNSAAEALVSLGDQRGLALFEQARKQLPGIVASFITQFEQRLRQSAPATGPKNAPAQ